GSTVLGQSARIAVITLNVSSLWVDSLSIALPTTNLTIKDPPGQEAFDRFVASNRGLRQMHGNGRLIDEIAGATNLGRHAELLRATAEYNREETTAEQHRQSIRPFLKNERLAFLLARDKIRTQAARGFETNHIRQVANSGSRTFANMSAAEVDRL
ncbi:unnamed protein product, partial [Didymodactylos carnosus]